MSPASLASRRTGRWHALLLSPCSLFVLLALPLDAAYCPFLFWQWRWGRVAQLHRPLAGDLKDAPLRHRLDQEVGQPPHQRIEAVRRVACPSPVKVRGKGAHLILQLREGADVVDPALFIER